VFSENGLKTNDWIVIPQNYKNLLGWYLISSPCSTFVLYYFYRTSS
jgi:hypothetical protein